MRFLNKKMICVLLAAVVLVSVPCYQTYARGHIDVNRTCTIMVDIPDSWTELKKVDFEVELYKVASVDENDVYTVLDDFLDIKEDMDKIGSKTTAQEWADIASTAANTVETNELKADKTITVTGGEGKIDVSTGLYLIYVKPVETTAYGFNFTPYLVSAPNNEYAMSGSGEDEWI